MSLPSVHLNVLAGPGPLAVPMDRTVLESVTEVKVERSFDGRSTFTILIKAGRTGPDSLIDDPLLTHAQLKVRNRVVLTAFFGVTPRVLIDGVITAIQMTPGSEQSATVLEVGGEDLSVLFDLNEKITEHPALPSVAAVTQIIGAYAEYGLKPEVIPPPSFTAPVPTEMVPVQRETDLGYINKIKPASYVFCMVPGSIPLSCSAYFGPVLRSPVPQKTLSVNMGPASNCSGLSFQFDSTQGTKVEGQVLDRQSGSTVSASSSASMIPPLSTESPASSSLARVTQLRETQGLTAAEAFAKAQAQSDKSNQALLVTGKLDAASYGDALEPGGIVGLRGAGLSHDGHYYVNKVVHVLKPGSYTQEFTLRREGRGSLVGVLGP